MWGNFEYTTTWAVRAAPGADPLLAGQHCPQEGFEAGLIERGADKQLLARAVGQGYRFPAVLGGDGHPDPHRTLCIPDRPDHAWDDGANLVMDHQPVQNRPQIFQNTVLDLELALRGA